MEKDRSFAAQPGKADWDDSDQGPVAMVRVLDTLSWQTSQEWHNREQSKAIHFVRLCNLFQGQGGEAGLCGRLSLTPRFQRGGLAGQSSANRFNGFWQDVETVETVSISLGTLNTPLKAGC